MNIGSFDALVKHFAAPGTRRGFLRGLVGSLAAAAGLRLAETDAAACRADGQTCTSNANCCGGFCGPKDARGRRTCGCPAPNQRVCGTACIPEEACCSDAECALDPLWCTVGYCDRSTGQCASKPGNFGGSCFDGNYCTINDTCNDEGSCVGQPVECPQLYPCADSVCVNGLGCGEIIRPGFCVIDGQCFQNGNINPQNPCQMCNSDASNWQWWSSPSGTVCGDDNQCAMSTCDGYGTCVTVNKPDNTECTITVPCFETAHCVSGECHGFQMCA
jgi:hypothetical protein